MTALLQVSTDIPAGNAVVLDVVLNGDVPAVHFTPSPRGGPEAIWFHFAITPSGAADRPKEIRCVMHLVDCLLGKRDGSAGFFPVYKTAEGAWTRVDEVETSRLDDGRPTASWLVPGDEGPVRVALCYPYAQAELDELVDALGPIFRSDVIGITQQDRPLHRLSNDGGSVGGKRPGVYCVARQHAAETPGSWMLDGFLRAIADAGPNGPLVWAVPFADLDGVLAGQAGKDRYPWDFNRAWGSKKFPRETLAATGSHPMRYEVNCMQTDMRRWRERCEPQLILDFHAPVMCQRDGIFCYVSSLAESGEPHARHERWTSAFREALDEDVRAEKFVRSGQYPSRWMTARIADFAIEVLGVTDITFETPYACTDRHIFTIETYQAAGRSIAEAVIGQVGNA